MTKALIALFILLIATTAVSLSRQEQATANGVPFISPADMEDAEAE